MDAVIIAGGLGTRLYPLTLAYPKILIPLLDRPLIAYLLSLVGRAGCERAVLAAGHMSDELKEYFSGRPAEDGQPGVAPEPSPAIAFAEEDEPLGTGGAVANAIRQEDLSGPLFVLNGDIVTDLEPRSLIAAHERNGAAATLVGYQVQDAERLGLLRVDSDDRVISFQEKSEDPGEPPYVISAGIYYFDSQVVGKLASRKGAFSLERDFFPELADRGQLLTHRHGGYWSDVGTLESYFNTQFAILRHWFTTGRENFGGMRKDFSLFKDFTYLHQNAKLGEKCELFHRVIIMDGAELGDRCRLRDSIVLPGAKIGEGGRLTTAIVDRGTSVSSGTDAENEVFSGKDREPFFPHP